MKARLLSFAAAAVALTAFATACGSTSPQPAAQDTGAADDDDMGMETMLEVREGAPLVKDKAASEKQNTVAISGFAFEPASITVKAGQAVTWTNEDPAEHTVTHEGGAFTSETLGRDARFRMVFDRPGTYRYVCALHPEMKGIVVVK